MIVANFLLNFISWVVYVFFFTAFSWLFFPVLFWKQFIVLYVYLFKPELDSVLSPYDSIFAIDSFYKKASGTNVKIIVLEGNVNIDSIRNGFIGNVLSVMDENNQPRFEKLFQIPISFGGYFFWKRIGIDVLHQIREECADFSNDPINHENELHMLIGELMAIPFRQQSPIWELILFRGYKTNQSVLVFRFHHSLGDGYSFNHLIDRMIQKVSAYTVKSRKTGCYDMTNIIASGAKNSWALGLDAFFHHDYYTQRKHNTTGVVSMTTIDLETMKRVRRATKSHFATVGMTLLTGALRRFFLERNLPGQHLPNYVSIMHSLPKPNHPINKMVNHWGVGLFKIPMHTTTALERLIKSENDFATFLSKRYDAWIKCHLIPMIGLMPSPLLRFAFRMNFGTGIGFTSMPAYEKEAHLFGQYKILDIFKVFGLQWSQSAATGALYSHNGKVSFAIYASKDIIPDQASIDLVTKEYLHDELQELLQQCGLHASQNNNNTVSPSAQNARISINIEG